jgi:hypothetical protein
MLSDDIILFFHICFIYLMALSIIFDNCDYKKIAFILLTFLLVQYLTQYGKCGLISIERFFLKDNFKNGFVYRLVKPVVDYRNNPIYDNYMVIFLAYIFILLVQIKLYNCNIDLVKDLSIASATLFSGVFGSS